MKVQLLYFPDCPNRGEARQALRRSLSSLGMAVPFEELDVTGPTTPEELQAWGSPTILVDGLDVGGELSPVGAGSCRLYAGTRGVPTDDQICALLRARRGGGSR